MTSKKNWLGLPAAILVFGMMIAACGGEEQAAAPAAPAGGAPAASGGGGFGGFGGGAPAAPAGNSLDGTWTGQAGEGINFAGGNFEMSQGGAPIVTGTYSVNGGQITFTVTAVSGDYVNAGTQGQAGLESRWYSKADMQAAGVPEEILAELYMAQSSNYSISGTTLTIDSLGTYTRSGGGAAASGGAPAMSGGNSLDGTSWAGQDGDEMVFQGSEWGQLMGGAPVASGTYSVSGGTLTFTTTIVSGDYINQMTEGQAGLESEGYSEGEMRAAGAPDELVAQLYTTQTASISGTTMTIDDGAGNRYTYTRQ